MTDVRILFIGLCMLMVATMAAQPETLQNDYLRWRLNGNGALSDNGIWLEMQSQQEWVPVVSDLGLWMAGQTPGGEAVFLSTSAGGQPRLAGSQQILNKVWTVTAEEIARHRADFEDNGVIDDPIPAIFSWPGKGNASFNAYNGITLPIDDVIRLDAGFWDINGTGHYDPLNGDFPILPVRGCLGSVLPTQMSYCVFTLLSSGGTAAVLPMQVQLYTFSFACSEEDHPLNKALFTLHKLSYTDEEPVAGGHPQFSNCYWGQWVDPDLGCPNDDYVGSFPELKAAYVYNSSNTDCASGLGPDFGDEPPALGIYSLRGPLDIQGNPVPISSINYYNNASVGPVPPATTAPVTLIEYYNYLGGFWRDGSPLTIGGTGYGGSEPTNFAFPGLPEQTNGWTEWEAQNPPGDRRLLINYGDFDLAPGAVNEFITAYSVYRGPGNHLDQAAGLRDQIELVQHYFDGCFDATSAPDLPACTSMVTSTDSALPAPGLSVFPNPATDWLEVELPATRSSNCTLRDLHGRVVFQQILAGGRQRLSLAALPAGIYILSAQTGAEPPVVAKIVVGR